MPRVGSNSSRTRLSASSHLAIAIFCWLPPEKAPTARPQRAAIDLDPVERRRHRRASRRARRSGRPRLKRSITGSETLCRPPSFRNSASVLRSSGTRLMPILARTASAGRGDRDRPAVDLDACPRSSSAMPKQARNRSSWPMPCSPATPRISPACRRNEASLQLARGRELVAAEHLRARRTAARRRAAERSWSSERPMIMLMTSSSAKSATRAGGDVRGRCAGRSACRRRRAPRAADAR